MFSLIDKVKSTFTKKKVVPEKKKREKKAETPQPEAGDFDPTGITQRRLKAKAAADAAKEAWVDVIFHVDPNNPHSGYADIDWNDKFIADLIRHGYQIKPTDTDQDIIYRWYIEVCRNEVIETYAQDEAVSQSRFTKTRDLGDGLSEVS